MSKRISAKYKIDRRMGENIWGRPKSPVNKRPFPPGQHGQNRRSKLSDFGTQLRAKQKLKGYYGNITEKQFRSTYDEATRQRGDASENLIGLLERRLDAVVLFMKGSPVFPQCGFSSTVVQILDYVGAPYESVNVLENPEIRQGIKDYNNWPTIPQIFVKGEFIGGCDILREMFESGELRTLFVEKGVPVSA